MYQSVPDKAAEESQIETGSSLTSSLGPTYFLTEDQKIAIEKDGFMRQFIPTENPRYFLPHAEEVYDRIRAVHYVMKAVVKRNIIVPIQDSSTIPRRVLDIGCAAGVWCIDVATEHPHWDVVGIDILSSFLSTHNIPNVEFKVVNATESWPFPDASFDFVHMRNMILSFSLEQYAFVMKEIMRVLKPGGYIQLTDPDFQPWKCGPLYAEFLIECCNALRSRGFETHIVRHYRKLITEAGLTDFHQSLVSLPIGRWGGVIGRVQYYTVKNPVRSFKSFFVEKSGLTPESWDQRLETAFTEVENHKGGYYNYHVAWAKKPTEQF